MSYVSLLERWELDKTVFHRVPKLEVLPSMSGQPHIADPATDGMEWPVSLCGTVLVGSGGKVEPGTHTCVDCVKIAEELEGEV